MSDAPRKGRSVKLVDDWKWTLKRAWSMRLLVISAVLSAAEVAIPFLAPAMPSGRFAAAAALVSLAAALARLVAQERK